MINEPKQWTLEGFVEHFAFVHDKMPDHKFVWVLGAGASLSSGIPLGSQLVDDWLAQMHLREKGGKMPLEEWATSHILRIDGFKYEDRAAFYPRIYQRRFHNYPEEGYAYLEDVMCNKDPSPGYSILAAALAHDPPRHNVVITTNFDNLVADALSIYTDTFPFVCGHESLATFVRVAMRRPMICKIHRDLLLAPQNDKRSLHRLNHAWGAALRGLFEHYTPIFIGYGGNDDTLMGLFESFEPDDIKGRMIWCYHEGGKPSDRIRDMVGEHKGILVPAPDFDLLMVLLGEKMGIGLLDEEIGRRADERTQRYRDRIQQLDTVTHPSVAKALSAIYARSGGWWAWEQKARAEKNPERRETVYRQGIQHCPKSVNMLESFANFLTDVRRKHDEAEQLYRKAFELDPTNALNIGNLARFLTGVRGEHREAEQLYRKTLKLNPKYPVILGNFAVFLEEVRGKHEEAEQVYDQALKLDPQNAAVIGNLAYFLENVRGEYDEAERRYREAHELRPKDANNTANFAGFLLASGRLDEAAEKLKFARSLGTNEFVSSELALYTSILATANHQDDRPALVELQQLLTDGIQHPRAIFDHLLAFTEKTLSAEDHALYAALAAAILDPEKLSVAIDLLSPRLAASVAKTNGKKNKRRPAGRKHGAKNPKQKARTN